MLPLMITAIENDDDRQLAAELYTRYRAVMLRRAGSILKEDDRAEEAVQEAMLRVIRHLEKVRMIPENERAYYLAAVTQTAALDLYRRRQREQQNTFTGYDESLDAPGPAEDGPMEMLLRREQAVLLRQCVALLPQRELSIEIRALAQHLDRVDDVLLHALGPIFKHGDLCRRRAGIDHKNSLQ